MSLLYRPPAPEPTSPVRALVKVALRFENDLLTLLPAGAYRARVAPLGYSRRSILIVNDPAELGPILANAGGVYPKNDLMVGALEDLVGHSLFVSDGEAWRRQRRMIEPAFSHMRIDASFGAMAAAVDACEARLDAAAASGEPISLDAAMGQLTADIICRTIFSRSLDDGIAREVFVDFATFEHSVANVRLARLLLGRPFAKVPQPGAVLAACRRIRGHLGRMLDERMASQADRDDIAAAVIAARDPETGQGFSREELIDQLGVFFLAGHETTASVLTWTFFVLSQQPQALERLRSEVDGLAGDGAVSLEQTKRLAFTRAVFREVLRLYPPITFIPRVAAEATSIAGRKVKRGAMIMVAPWTIHRNPTLWRDADRFDPDRFMPGRDTETRPGSYIPFGLGPRICVGAAFAMIESALILARLARRYDLEPVDPASVRPVARLTTRPVREIMCRVRRRPAADGAFAA